MKYKLLLAISISAIINNISLGQINKEPETLLANTNPDVTMNEELIDHEKTVKKDEEVRVAPWFVERLTLTAGFFAPISNTNIRVSTTRPGANGGTDLDFENDLGFDKRSQTFLAGAQWRITRRSRMDLTYYHLNRSSSYRLDKDITFGDNTYGVDSEVKSFFNTNIYRFSYGYAIVAKPKFEAGLLIGAHILGAKVGIGYTNNNTSGGVTNDFGFTAPLPNFGIWVGYEFGKRMAINAEFDYLALTIKDISGRIIGCNVNLKYRLLKNLDISAGYTGLNFRVDVSKEKANGSFKWGYNGPTIAASFWFGGRKWLHD